jgi:hypothetical protein
MTDEKRIIKKIMKWLNPTLFDGGEVQKFLVPIVPKYHDRLFPEYKQDKQKQITLSEAVGGPKRLNIQGNAIKKAYISHARTKQIKEGDIVLFYRSDDESSITSIGVVEEVYFSQTKQDKITEIVGDRTVYSPDEIKDMCEKPTLVILFKIHFHFPNPINKEKLDSIGVSWPQQVNIIDEEKYQMIKELGGLDGCFTVN